MTSFLAPPSGTTIPGLGWCIPPRNEQRSSTCLSTRLSSIQWKWIVGITRFLARRRRLSTGTQPPIPLSLPGRSYRRSQCPIMESLAKSLDLLDSFLSRIGSYRIVRMSIDAKYSGRRVILNVNDHYEGSAPLTIAELRRLFEGAS